MDTNYYKLHIQDLWSCREIPDTSPPSWNLEIENDTQLEVRFVWIQGKVEEVQEDLLVLKDDTGTCQIATSNAIHSSNEWLKPGVHCAILGHIESLTPSPIVTALKITNISNRPVLIDMWPLEVDELKKFLAGLVQPVL